MTPCDVKWCAALAEKGSRCRLHHKLPDLHPGMPLDQPEAPTARTCATCDGKGKCPGCDGEGLHYCEHLNCHDEHDCRKCNGSGECPECEDGIAEDVAYLAFAFDVGYTHPLTVEWPWDAECRG